VLLSSEILYISDEEVSTMLFIELSYIIFLFYLVACLSCSGHSKLLAAHLIKHVLGLLLCVCVLVFVK
jgi:hypothetical protein